MNATSLVIIGNATQDVTFFVERIPENDEVLSAKERIACLGGRGVVPALVAGALGAEPQLCTVIGAGVRGEFESLLSSAGVRSDAIKWDARASSTTQYTAFIGSGGLSVAVVYPADLDWAPTDAQRRAVSAARFVYFSTNDLGFNADLLEHVSAEKQLVIHNLGVRFSSRVGYIDEMLRASAYLVGNQVEIRRLEEAAGKSVEEILGSTPTLKAIIATRGGDDVLVHERHRHFAVPIAASVSVASPVGAGDALAAGLIVALSEGESLETAVRRGARLGQLAVESKLSYPDLSTVAAFARTGSPRA